MADVSQQAAKQLLHLVFGGELKSVASMEFRDLSKLVPIGFHCVAQCPYSELLCLLLGGIGQRRDQCAAPLQ